jgi:very-short-patch-repair endonuclease
MSLIAGVNPDTSLLQLATQQHHLIVRSDVALVMTSRQWSRRLDQGWWRELAPGVWCHRAVPVDWRLQARAGSRSLGRAAALHGRTSAAWWPLGGVDVSEPEFLVPRTRKHRPFPFVLHSTRHFDRCDLLVHDGIRLTNATRTVIDMAIIGRPAIEIERVIDDAMQRRLTSLPTLATRVQELCGPGVRGSTMLRALVLDSGGESHLERRFLALVRRAGLVRPRCQVVHRHDGKRIARVDFQFPGTNVIVEVTGRLGHVSDRDRQRDARRRNELQASGYVVLEFTTADVLDEQAYVVDSLRAHLARAGTR